MKPRTALLPVPVGALLLVASYIFGWTHINVVQLSALALIIIGIVTYVALLKQQSKY